MSNDLDPQPAASSAADRFPFVMVLTTTFLLGGVFVVANAPLVMLVSEVASPPNSSCQFKSFSKVLSCGVAPLWKAIFEAQQGISLGFFFLMLSLLCGLLLAPLDRLNNHVLAWLWSLVRRRMKPSSYVVAFTPAVFSRSDHPAFLSALMNNRIAKAHWEWELFHYYIRWGLVTNVTIFIALSVVLQWPHISLSEVLVFAAVFMAFFGLAGLHAELMTRVHLYYKANATEDQSNRADAPRQRTSRHK